MKILSVNSIYPSTQFQAKITKKMLEELDKKSYELQKQQLQKSAAYITAGITGISAANCDKFFEANGFTYTSQKDNSFNLASGYNGGYYTVKTRYNEEDTDLKEYVANKLATTPSAFGGLMNYKECIKDLKRQDLIQKGLKIHTYAMDPDVDDSTKTSLAKDLSNYISILISPNDLFFINSDAFYYDKKKKTVYSTILDTKGKRNFRTTLNICKFETDKHGNAVGFNVKSWDIFQQKQIEKVYREQSKPSIELDPIVDYNRNKDLAEAFRFGNNEHDHKIRKAGPIILNHLSSRVGIKCPQTEDIKYVKFYDKNKNIVARFAYYDSSIGRSLVYNTDGKYLYQMQYDKDDFGNIIACSKF